MIGGERFALGDASPEIDATAWIAPGARVMGRVRLRAHASVWYNAVLRGDNEQLDLGERSNLQDGAVVHSDPGCPVIIGPDVTVGHNAIIHGCEIGAGALIGMGATVLNGAKIGAGCLVGANALVTEGKVFDEGSLIVGSPAKAVRVLDEAARAALLESAARYVANAARHRAELRPL